MTQTNKRQVKTRLPPHRAEGLEPEYTAQPKAIPDELALEASGEPELSVDPDDLGSRFLRDAVEQGDFDPERGWPEDSSLIDSPSGDAPISSTNFIAGNSVWEQTVDLETRTQGAADLLREPAPPAAAEVDVAFRETVPEPIDVQDNGAHLLDNSVREFSLFDAEDEVDDEPSRTHTRPEPVQEPRVHNRRTSGQAAQPAQARPTSLLRSALKGSARALRSIASRLPKRGS